MYDRVRDWLWPRLRRIGVILVSLYLRAARSVGLWQESAEVVICPTQGLFHVKARAIAECLRAQGLSVELSSCRRGVDAAPGSPDFRVCARSQVSKALWIILCGYIPTELRPRRYVIYNAEPLGVELWRTHEARNLMMSRALEVWDYSASNRTHVESLKIPFVHVPYGYSRLYEQLYREHTSGRRSSKDIDVLFYGTVSPRRTKVFGELRAQGLSVTVCDWDRPRLGKDLDLLIQRSKIVLAMHVTDDVEGHTNDLPRIAYLIANQAFVVVERPVVGPPDALDESGIAVCSYSEIVQRCRYFADREEERREKARQSYFWFKERYLLCRWVPELKAEGSEPGLLSRARRIPL